MILENDEKTNLTVGQKKSMQVFGVLIFLAYSCIIIFISINWSILSKFLEHYVGNYLFSGLIVSTVCIILGNMYYYKKKKIESVNFNSGNIDIKISISETKTINYNEIIDSQFKTKKRKNIVYNSLFLKYQKNKYIIIMSRDTNITEKYAFIISEIEKGKILDSK